MNEVSWTDREPPPDVQPEKLATYDEIAKCWPWIRDRLEVIKKKDATGSGHWLPEHIRHQAMLGLGGGSTCEIFVARQGGVLYGFGVTEVLIDRYVQVPMTLHIWAGWLNKTMINKFIPFFDNLARARGVRRITFETGRFGWHGTVKALADGGFAPSTIVYAREVR